MAKRDLSRRYRRLMAFFFRLTVSLGWWEVVLPAVGLRFLTRRTRSYRLGRVAADFRLLAVEMGGVMIKVGQFLSARLDVLPDEVTAELEGLQDEVPAEEFEAIRSLAEAELGASLETAFESFDAIPIAAASLGQGHRARLRADAAEAGDYRDVVVKIQRPGIAELIQVDFAALHRFGTWLQRYRPLRRRVDVLALIKEVSDTVHREIDYLAEGANAEAFASNFVDRKRICVPRVAWSRTTLRVLTLENVRAIKINDYDAIEASGVGRPAVARALFDAYLRQIFEDHFFHADPHPGNLFVAPPQSGNGRGTGWRLTFVDFGMVGTVPESLQRGLREALLGIGTRDAARVVSAYQILGILLPGANMELLRQAESQMFDRFWGMSMRELRSVHHDEMHQFAIQFRELIYSLPFQLPHNLLLLGRTIAILSGMCTGLDPEFNPWRQLAPYATQILGDKSESGADAWLDRLGDLARELLALPAQAGRVLTKLERGELQVRSFSVDRQSRYLAAAINRLYGGLLFVGFLLGGVVLYTNGSQTLSTIFWGLAALSLLGSILPPRRRF
jgi:predicted unusual protein kinase regulating ubiquinone biosynthesis (AarF/ABC1/UbiB family)